MKKNGFTLVELLVVIAIVAVLSVIGVVVFKAVTNSARDAQRKADLDSMSKAYEIKYSSTGAYPALYTTDFATGRIPKTPEGNSYPCIIGPEASCITQSNSKVAYCVSLGDNQSAPCYVTSSSCYCTSSTLGSPSSGSGGVGSNPSCDPNAILSAGLVGYWKMDESSWTNDCSTSTVLDSSGNGNNGKSCPNAAGTQPTLGKFGNAGSFDGSNDYVSVADSLTLRPTAFTLSIWVNPGDAGQWRNILGKQSNNSATGYSYGFRRPAGDRIFAEIFVGGVQYRITETVALAVGTWAHYALTYDGTTFKAYKNGSSSPMGAPVNISGTIDPSVGNILGIGAGIGYGNYNGFLDDVRLYNRVLSDQEINLLYNSGNGCVP